ncbi:hypothetical protein HMI56_004856 [Coelomomyces lativittatus]|nr:hypothetical protein HMI56_004856 [Coelomomyces lativittatus]
MKPQEASMEPAEPSGPPQRPTLEVTSPQIAFDIVDSKGVCAHLSQINIGIPKLSLDSKFIHTWFAEFEATAIRFGVRLEY